MGVKLIHHDPAAGLEHAASLGKGGRDVQVMRNIIEKQQIDTVIRFRQPLGWSNAEPYSGQRLFLCALASDIHRAGDRSLACTSAPSQADGILAITTARHKDMLPGQFLSQKTVESRSVAVPGTPRLVLDDIEVDRFIYLVTCPRRTRLMAGKFSLLPFIQNFRGLGGGLSYSL